MRAKGIAWLGIETDRVGPMQTFLRDALGMDVMLETEGFSGLACENGDRIEIFGPHVSQHAHLFATNAVVAGFLVDDIVGARAELAARGVELLGELDRDDGYAWQHFRAPDGRVYELCTELR